MRTVNLDRMRDWLDAMRLVLGKGEAVARQHGMAEKNRYVESQVRHVEKCHGGLVPLERVRVFLEAAWAAGWDEAITYLMKYRKSVTGCWDEQKGEE